MARAESIALIKRSPEEVWEYLSDLTHAPEYVPGLTHVVVSPGRIGPGTRVTEVRRNGHLRGVLEVVEWDPPERLRLKSGKIPLQADRLYQLRPTPNGTLLSYETEIRGSGWAKLIELLIRGAIQRDTKTMVQAIKSQIEARG